MAIKVTKFHHFDIFHFILDFLDTAKLLSSLETGNQLAFELTDFAQKAAQEAANANEQH